jgi:hypothetical protein
MSEQGPNTQLTKSDQPNQLAQLFAQHRDKPLVGYAGREPSEHGRLLGRIVIEVWDRPNTPEGKGAAYMWDLSNDADAKVILDFAARDMGRLASALGGIQKQP